jgi:hypothetical protein
MKMEHLATGSDDCPLLRLYDFTPNEVGQLCGVFTSLASGTVCIVALHEQPFIQPVDGCRLTLRAAKRDKGIEAVDTNSFECILTEDGWEDEAERAKSLTGDDARGHHQWLLNSTPSEIRLLLSCDGCW